MAAFHFGSKSPQGIAGVLPLVPVALALLSPRRGDVLLIAGICVAIVFLGVVVPPFDGGSEIVTVEQISMVLAIGVVAAYGFYLKRPDKLESQPGLAAHHDQEARQWLGKVVDSSRHGMVILDKIGSVVLANSFAEQIFGYDKGELLGHSIDLLVRDHEWNGQSGRIRQFFDSPEQWQLGVGNGLTGQKKDGTVFSVEFTLYPLQLGQDRFALASVVDTTAQKLREAELSRYTEQLKKSNQELEQFAYIASHDLQEPLRKVASFCNLLQEEYADKLDDTARGYIRHAVEGAIRMRTLVADLLRYSRAGRTDQRPVPVDAQIAYKRVIDNLTEAIGDADAIVSADELPPVLADEMHLVQLLQNLVGNALKYRHPSRRCEVFISAKPVGGQWRFAITDNGIGFEPIYADRIFRLFQRLHGRGEYSGTGVGLAICQKIVEGFGGRIWAESIPGNGATFYFTLPMATEKPAEPMLTQPMVSMLAEANADGAVAEFAAR